MIIKKHFTIIGNLLMLITENISITMELNKKLMGINNLNVGNIIGNQE